MSECEVSKTSGPQKGGNIQLCDNRRNVNFNVCLLSGDQRIKLFLVASSRLELRVVSRHCKICTLERGKCSSSLAIISKCVEREDSICDGFIATSFYMEDS